MKLSNDEFRHLAPKEATFYPSSPYSWDDTEVEPVAVVASDGSCEPVEEGQEHFWSVYLHLTAGGVNCIADLPTKEKALEFAKLIDAVAKTFVSDKLKEEYKRYDGLLTHYKKNYELLQAALFAFNEIPNKKISHPLFKDTYAIAAAIGKGDKNKSV